MIHVNIVLYASSQGSIWSLVELIVWFLSILHKQSTGRQAGTGFEVQSSFYVQWSFPQFQSSTHVFFKEPVSHNATVQLVCGRSVSCSNARDLKRGTLKASVNEPRNIVVQKSLSHFLTNLLGMFAEKKRAQPDEKASVMKELPSDIWHPLLSSSLNQQGDSTGGEILKFRISAS